MIDFEEEIAKFQPSLEVDDAEEDIVFPEEHEEQDR